MNFTVSNSNSYRGCPDGHPVMVVEDDPDIRECVQMILEDEGFKVITASNGAEAEEELSHMKEPCVMLLDLMMPVMSGWELLDHLQRDGRLDDGMHVVVVSATLGRLPKGSSVECMRKPVRADQLIATVRQYC
ncbi:MAG: chemotaxis protein CheY [bacterium]|nr:chemotaxis protein CheY [bacterium]